VPAPGATATSSTEGKSALASRLSLQWILLDRVLVAWGTWVYLQAQGCGRSLLLPPCTYRAGGRSTQLAFHGP
jgi:hypothetical protein